MACFRRRIKVFKAKCGSLDGIATITMVVVAPAHRMIWRFFYTYRLLWAGVLYGVQLKWRADGANHMVACSKPAYFRLEPLPAFPFTVRWILCHGGVEMPWRAPPPSTSPWHLCQGGNSEVNETRG